MMPEGLLQPLSDQEVRDLIYYLSRPGQVPLPASAASADAAGNSERFDIADVMIRVGRFYSAGARIVKTAGAFD